MRFFTFLMFLFIFQLQMYLACVVPFQYALVLGLAKYILQFIDLLRKKCHSLLYKCAIF